MSTLSDDVEKRLQEQISKLEERISKIETGGNYAKLGENVQGISIDFINSTINKITDALRTVLSGNSVNVDDLIQNIKGSFEKKVPSYISDSVFRPQKIDREEANRIIQEKRSKFQKEYDDWIYSSDYSQKSKLEEEIKKDFSLRNAAINQLYYNLQDYYNTAMNFEEFLETEFPFYRGAAVDQKYKRDSTISFSTSRKAVEDFNYGQNSSVFEKMVKPKDTYGIFMTPQDELYGEAEVWIPSDLLINEKTHKLIAKQLTYRDDFKKLKEISNPTDISDALEKLKLNANTSSEIQQQKEFSNAVKESVDRLKDRNNELIESSKSNEQEKQDFEQKLVSSSSIEKAIEDQKELIVETKKANEALSEQAAIKTNDVPGHMLDPSLPNNEEIRTENANTVQNEVKTQAELQSAVKESNDQLINQDNDLKENTNAVDNNAESLEKMILLWKEYYDSLYRAESSSGKLKDLYVEQSKSIEKNIEDLEKKAPKTKDAALSDFGVKLQKAKYEDLVDANQRNALKKVKTPLEEMISLYKEYYDLKIKVSSSNISDNVKGVYEGQIKQISADIDTIESNNSGTKKQALLDMEVALRKAKYEDIVDSQKLKDLENAKKLYQDYLDAVSQLQLLNRENYFAYATKQDNTELQKKVDAQNQLVNSLRAELDTKKSILSLTDADIVKATSSRTLGKKSYAKYFDSEYQKQFDEYIKATNEYYDAIYKLYNAEGKSADDATIQKYRKDAEDLAKAYEAAKSKYEAFVSFASSSAGYSVDVAAYQKKYEEQTQAGKNRYSQVFNKQLNDLVANSGDKIESYSKVIGTLRDKILQLQQIETKDNLNFDTDVKEVVSLNKEIQLLIKLLKSDAFNKTNKIGTVVGQFQGDNPLTSIESVKSLVQNYSDLGSSMKKIENVSLGKDLKTATVEIITQDGNIKKLKLSYDDTTKSLRYLTLSEQHYATAGEKLKAAIKNKITQLGAYVSTAVLVREVFNMYRQGAQYVTELDTALTEFQLVTRKSNSAVSGMKAEVEDLANALATTNTEVTSSITNWSRLGYAASDSLDLAASSAKYAKVGFTDINTATTNLTSTIQAYKDSMYIGQDIGDFAEDIVDKYVNIGNNFAITSEGIGTALQKSASTLVAAGNSLDQAIALVTAGNSVLQDESMVGSGLKIVGMRLRGKRLCPPMKKFLGKHDNYIGSSLEIDLAEERLLS